MLSPYVTQDDTDEVVGMLNLLVDTEEGEANGFDVDDVSSDYMEGGYVRISFDDQDGGPKRTYVLKVYEER